MPATGRSAPSVQTAFAALSRGAGNRAIGQRLAARARVQSLRTMRVSAPADRAERTADRVAIASTRGTATTERAQTTTAAKSTAPRHSLAGSSSDAKATFSLGEGRPPASSVRQAVESQVGVDLSPVRVHTGARAAQAAESLQAHAFTMGRDVVFGHAQYQPATASGRALLAHELAHVAQQRTGLSPPGTVLRQAKPLDNVKQVRSLEVDDVLKKGKSEAESGLDMKVVARRVAIQKALDSVAKLESHPWAKKKADELRADLAKSLDMVLTTPDSRHVNRELRAEIVAVHQRLGRKISALTEGEKKFHRLDDVFASDPVTKVLAPKGFTPAELKALVAQESGDLTKSDKKGDIAGVAQISKAAAKEVGADPKDRLDDKKAILLAAKVLIEKTRQFDALTPAKPAGADYKKLVFASYNAGTSTIVAAQERTLAMKRDPKKWDDLIAGGDKSPLFEAIKKKLPKLGTAAKYKETTTYVARILRRLP